MSGHSKWATIKRDKAVNDAKKSKVFSKLSRAITVAAKTGGGDMDANASLRLAVDRAKEARMPKDNVEKAISKGTGTGADAANYFDVIYEAFGPGGEAFYVKGLTDNKNRTAAEIRNIFSKHGGSLGGPGSTAYIFTPDVENPVFMSEPSESQKDSLLKLMDELDDNEDIQDIYVNFEI